MSQNFHRVIWAGGAPANALPPVPDGVIDERDRRHLAGLFRGHFNLNKRRCIAGLNCVHNLIAPNPDGDISPTDIRHLVGLWRNTLQSRLPMHLFFGRNG